MYNRAFIEFIANEKIQNLRAEGMASQAVYRALASERVHLSPFKKIAQLACAIKKLIAGWMVKTDPKGNRVEKSAAPC